MSYDSILKTLQTKTVKGLHIALGLRKPGESTGIWLLGEDKNHEVELSAERNGIMDGIDVENLVLPHVKDTVLFYEGTFPPGDSLFAKAPRNIKKQVKANAGDDDEDLTVSDGTYDSLETLGYSLDEAGPNTRRNYSNPEWWADVLEYQGVMEYVGRRFDSNGGITINIENPIRHYFAKTIDSEVDVDVDSFFNAISWALQDKIPADVKPIGGAPPRSSTIRDIEYRFYYEYLRNIKHRWGDAIKGEFLVQITSKILVYMEEKAHNCRNYKDFKNKFEDLFTLTMMDMNVIPRTRSHYGKNFISFGGDAHIIRQYVILLNQGYVLEHTHIATGGKDFLTPADKERNMTYNERADIHDEFERLMDYIRLK